MIVIKYFNKNIYQSKNNKTSWKKIIQTKSKNEIINKKKNMRI